MTPVLDKVVDLVQGRRETVDLLWAIWRDAARDLQDADRDLRECASSWPDKARRYACVFAALEIERVAAEKLEEALS